MQMRKKMKVATMALSIGLLVSPHLAINAKEDALQKTQKMTMSVKNDVGWGIPRKKEGEIQPYPGEAYHNLITENDAYYIGDPEDDAIYLTFDCGYENGNLPLILDALLAEGVPALFFVTGHFMEEEPELLRRMATEGHLVGNHTYDHPDLTTISKERFMDELARGEEKYYEITGEEMSKFLRPPEGRFNQEVLDWASEAGYYTVLWSLAYVDLYVDRQQGPAYALDQITDRLHPGAILLLHSTSSDNAQAMDELLPILKEEGYQFRSLHYLLTSDLPEPIE